jgi:hypothetical protein
VVYNLHRLIHERKPGNVNNPLILVESYAAVWKVHQAGFSSVACLTGAALSKYQEKLLVDFLGPTGRLALFFANTDPGNKQVIQCLGYLSQFVFVKWLDLVDITETETPAELTAQKPAELTTSTLKAFLAPHLSG